MSFKLSKWPLDRAGNLAAFYNAQTADLDYAYPVTPEIFAQDLALPRYDEEPHAHLRDEHFWVAEENGEVVGFAHVAEEEAWKHNDHQARGVIRHLNYVPGKRPVGQALLAAVEAHFSECKLENVCAFAVPYTYRFYVLGYGVSDRQGHVTALFRMNGYEISHGEILMDWRNFSTEEPERPDEKLRIEVEEKPGRGVRNNVEVRVLQEDKEVLGACESVSLGHRLGVAELQDMCFVHWLWVRDEHQHRGWGRYLLMRSHWEMQRLGYRHTAISTSTSNHRALLFYTNYGYRVVDTWYEYGKSLDG